MSKGWTTSLSAFFTAGGKLSPAESWQDQVPDNQRCLTLQSPLQVSPPSVWCLPALVNNPSLIPLPPGHSQAFCPALSPPFSPGWPSCFSTWFSWCRCPLLLGNLSNKLFLVVVIYLLPYGTQIRTSLKLNLHIDREGRVSRRVRKSLNIPDKHSPVHMHLRASLSIYGFWQVPKIKDLISLVDNGDAHSSSLIWLLKSWQQTAWCRGPINIRWMLSTNVIFSGGAIGH